MLLSTNPHEGKNELNVALKHKKFVLDLFSFAVDRETVKWKRSVRA